MKKFQEAIEFLETRKLNLGYQIKHYDFFDKEQKLQQKKEELEHVEYCIRELKLEQDS